MFRLRSLVLAIRGKPQADKSQRFKVSYDFYRLPDGIGDHGVSMEVARADSPSVGTGCLQCGVRHQTVTGTQQFWAQSLAEGNAVAAMKESPALHLVHSTLQVCMSFHCLCMTIVFLRVDCNL